MADVFDSSGDTLYTYIIGCLVSVPRKFFQQPATKDKIFRIGDLIEEVRGMGYEQVVLTGVQFPNIITRKQDFGASGGKSREGRAAQLTADIAAWQSRFAGSVTLWVSYPDALCTAATDALGTTGTSLGMENLLVTSGLFICNLGTGKGYSVLDVIHAFSKACGKEIPYVIDPRRPGDIAECYADPTKAKNELGWVAEYGIEEMCADSWNWQKKNPDGYHTAN